MKRYFFTLIIILSFGSAFAQFPTSATYRLWYKYEYDIIDGMQIKKDGRDKYYFILINQGKVWDWSFNSTWSIEMISEEKAMDHYDPRYPSNFAYYNEVASDSKQWVYTTRQNGQSWHLVFKPDLSAFVDIAPTMTCYYKRIDLSQEKANANKMPQRFFDE